MRKIKDIQYEKVLPDAVGNWIELKNTLNDEFTENPLYKRDTLKYQSQLITKFNYLYNNAQLDNGDIITKSKRLYNNVIGENPLPMNNITPPLAYKNGLIHDAMDNESYNVKWRVDDE